MSLDISKISDYELITEVLKGDNDYFAELVRRYKNLVYSVIYRMNNNPDESNDLAQDVFLKIYKNLDKYYPDYKFSTWIIRITTNHVIDFHRKKRQEAIPIDDVEYDMSHYESPEYLYLQKERRDLFSQMLNALPEMYRIPIVLYHQQGLSYQEISDVIEEPLSKVKNRIFRGRKMLKENLMSMKEGESYGLL